MRSPASRSSSGCRSRARRSFSPQTVALLNALAIGILLYLVVEIAQNAIVPISQALNAWHAGGRHLSRLLLDRSSSSRAWRSVSSASAARRRTFTRQAAKHAENPIVLAAIIAIGIGAHNFGEGLAIGASAASGATAIALALIVGFGLHNATEGFGVAAPLVGKVVPSWAQIGLAGLIAGGPDVHRHDRRLQFLLADALGALPRDRDRRARIRHRRVMERAASQRADGVGNRDDVRRVL